MAALLFVSIPMVILMSDSGLGQSLSRLKTVTTSSINKEWVGSLAVDGNYDTDASGCNCCAGTSMANLVDQWLEIDFGEPTEFNHIVVYGQTNGPWPRQNLIGLSIYLDDSETSIASIVNTGQGFVNFHHFDLGQRYKATLIKLILKGRNKVLVLCEVDVFNGNIISKGKDVTAISTYPGWNSSHAVDGDMRTNADVCLCCAATYYHTNPWLHVDLGNDFLITFIQMFGRTDKPAVAQSLDGMRISVDDVIIHTVPTSNTFISYSEIVLSSETVGIYVNFTLIGEHKLLVMCEVLIHGVCKAGTYGTNCGETCGNCKDNNTCNPENGQCTECEDGYIETDKTCKTNCPDGRYGYNCSETCGNCINGQICNSKTGHCQECEDGYTYTDPLCKTVCDDGTYGTNCSKTCGSCRGDEMCNTVNGYCTECEDGYMESDKNCKTLCENGTYGTNCSTTCGNCRNDEICDTVNGHCTVCEDGYLESDNTCKTKCPNGTYGQNCQHTCGMCACGEMCDGRTVKCRNGCSNGYLGEACLQRISQDEAPGTTISLPVYIGSVIASSCVTLAVTLAIMFWKLKRIKTSNSKGEANEARGPVPSTQSEAASNYDSLQLSNIQSESDYSELQ